MIGRSQFTLSYLFLEILWIAAALGCFTQAVYAPGSFGFFVFLYGVFFTGVAIGGLFGKMHVGFWIGLGLVTLLVLGGLAVAPFLVPRE